MQLSPVFNIPFFTDTEGNPLAGGCIYAYEAGSFSTLKATYADEGGLTANTNPIVLDSAGMLPGVSIWLEDGELYNLVLTYPDGTSVLKSFDNVSGIVLLSTGGSSASPVWVPVSGGTYLSPTSFLVPGDYTQQFPVGNRARITQPSGLTYGVVSSVGFSSGNTIVTIINDGVVLNPSLTQVDYSVLLPAPNETVDAGGVSYFSTLSYSLANTVGNKLKSLDVDIAGVEAKRERGMKLWTTGGTGSAFTLTPTPAVTSYTNENFWSVRFHAASSGATLNINGVGAKTLQQFDASGSLVAVSFTAGYCSNVAYNATADVFVLLDPQATAAVTPPHGMQVFTSNGTFTVPANVYAIEVTCVGGGGGGGGGTTSGDIESGFNCAYGGTGGSGVTGVSVLSVTPGAGHSVSIGAAGTGSTGTGGSGGTTTFGGSLVSAGGGGGGSTGGSGAGGTGGSATFKTNGLPGSTFSTGGGSSYGGGGGGGFCSGVAGSAGKAGVCVVKW